MTVLLYDSGTSYDTPVIYDTILGGPFFTPPTVLIDPPYLPETTGPALSLFRHYTPRAVGVNVFLLSDGTYAQDYATPENQNTSIPYPWDPYNPGAPFARIYDFHGHETDVRQNPYIVKVYYGAHRTPITLAEETALIAAGYGAYIS